MGLTDPQVLKMSHMTAISLTEIMLTYLLENTHLIFTDDSTVTNY